MIDPDLLEDVVGETDARGNKVSSTPSVESEDNSKERRIYSHRSQSPDRYKVMKSQSIIGIIYEQLNRCHQ